MMMLLQRISLFCNVMGKNNFQFKKEFGQNFLRDVEAILDIITAVAPQPADRILEIGPGGGALSEYLIANVEMIYLVEVDPILAAELESDFGSYPNVEIINADILKLPVQEFILKNKINKVVGALPYNISKKIVDIVCGDFELLHLDSTFILQKEVAFNYVGQPHTTFLHEYYKQLHELELLGVIEKSKFFPVPKVDSAGIKFTPKIKNKLKLPATALNYKKFVKQAFLNPRKKLIKNLKNAYPQVEWTTAYKKLKLDDNIRVEQLTTEYFLQLWQFVN